MKKKHYVQLREEGMNKHYDWLKNIGSLSFENKSVLIIGGSDLAKQYALASKRLGVRDLTIITKTGKLLSKFCDEQKIKLIVGGFENNLTSVKKKDLVIVAPPLHLTIAAAKLAIESNQDNVLIEKPGSLYPDELLSLQSQLSSQDIRVAYNRLVYPNLHCLKELVQKEGGITSCRFTFTERLSSIDFEKDTPEVYQRWGISNSLHVITMALDLIGMPREIHPYQYGQLEWHPSGSIFVGTGITEKNIPFSYHADWGSGGRWGIEVNTHENSYQLVPLEELYSCPRDKGVWNKIEFEKAFSDIKQGIVEEVAIMLNEKNEHKSMLPTLEKTAEYNRLAENIFGYT